MTEVFEPAQLSMIYRLHMECAKEFRQVILLDRGEIRVVLAAIHGVITTDYWSTSLIRSNCALARIPIWMATPYKQNDYHSLHGLLNVETLKLPHNFDVIWLWSHLQLRAQYKRKNFTPLQRYTQLPNVIRSTASRGNSFASFFINQ